MTCGRRVCVRLSRHGSSQGDLPRHAGWAEDSSRLRLGEPQPGAAGWAQKYAAQQVCAFHADLGL